MTAKIRFVPAKIDSGSPVWAHHELPQISERWSTPQRSPLFVWSPNRRERRKLERERAEVTARDLHASIGLDIRSDDPCTIRLHCWGVGTGRVWVGGPCEHGIVAYSGSLEAARMVMRPQLQAERKAEAEARADGFLPRAVMEDR